MDFISISAGLLAGLMWSLDQLFGKMALRYTNPNGMNLIRYITLLPFTTFFIIYNHSLKSIPLLFIFLGILNGLIEWGVSTLLFFFVLSKESLHRIIPVANSFPVWVAVLSTVFLSEKITLSLVISLILMFIGIRLLVPEEEGKKWKWGIPLAVCVAVSASSSMTFSKYILKYVNQEALIFLKTLGAFILFTSLFPVAKYKEIKRSIFFSLASGITLLLGEFSYLFALRRTTASYTSILCNTVIPFGFVLSILVLREKPTKMRFIGMLFVFAAVVFISVF